MQKVRLETIVGVIVIVLCVFFGYYIYKIKTVSSYANTVKYFARFNSIDGVDIGSDVRLGGVKVGTVQGISFDDSLTVIVEIDVKNDLKIPQDSSLAVSSSGILSGKFLEIKPGGADDFLTSGAYFNSTQSSVSLEGVIGKFAGKS
jgi:phospholipid/cholesterol/gamma-HCH transport system substrate-binding protein